MRRPLSVAPDGSRCGSWFLRDCITPAMVFVPSIPLAALGHDQEVAMHVRATANTGATREDICEALLHVAIYAGVPAANHAIAIVKSTFEEMDAA